MLPLAISPRATRVTIVLFSVGLVAATIALEPLHVAGPGYLGVRGAAGRDLHRLGGGRVPARGGNAWARSLFFYSIVYLTLLFVALVDRQDDRMTALLALAATVALCRRRA